MHRFLTSVLELTDQLLLLGVDRDHGLTPLQKGLRRRIDVLELRVPVGVRGAFPTLAHRLQTITKFMQQTTHRRRTHLPPSLRQRRRELRPTLTRPPQW